MPLTAGTSVHKTSIPHLSPTRQKKKWRASGASMQSYIWLPGTRPAFNLPIKTLMTNSSSIVLAEPTKTTAGSGVKGFDGFMNYAEKMSPLGNASGEECANYCTLLFSDYAKKVTMQNLFHDGGFSFTGVTAEVIEQMEK